MQHQFSTMRSPQMHRLAHIISMFRGVTCWGTCFHSGSQLFHLACTKGKLMSRVFFWCIWFYSMYIGLTEPPNCASIVSVADMSLHHSALRMHLFQCTCQLNKLQCWTAIVDINIYNWSSLQWTLQDVNRMASSLTRRNLLHNFSRYSIAVNFLCIAYTLSPTFPNFLSL